MAVLPVFGVADATRVSKALLSYTPQTNPEAAGAAHTILNVSDTPAVNVGAVFSKLTFSLTASFNRRMEGLLGSDSKLSVVVVHEMEYSTPTINSFGFSKRTVSVACVLLDKETLVSTLAPPQLFVAVQVYLVTSVSVTDPSGVTTTVTTPVLASRATEEIVGAFGFV